MMKEVRNLRIPILANARGDGRRLLSLERRRELMPLAIIAVLAAAVLTGVSIALKVPALAKYPGTEGDPIMRVLTYTLVAISLGVLFKFMVVPIISPALERKVGRNRRVRLRDVFNREIAPTAIVGGVLNVTWYVLFLTLVTVMAPSALAAGRACAVLPLAIVELWTRVLRPTKRVMVRLALSLPITLIGAAIAIFAGGFHIFKGEGSDLYLWLFILMLGPGNFLLAVAEQAELRGVDKEKTASGVYTFARYVYVAITSVVAVVVWGLINGGWSVFWNVLQMCYDRWLYILPIALLGAAADLVRITVKVVIPATFMFVVGAISTPVEGIVQAFCKLWQPDVYTAVPSGWEFAMRVVFGGIVIVCGSWIFPHGKEEDEKALEPVPVMTPA